MQRAFDMYGDDSDGQQFKYLDGAKSMVYKIK
jgi:hypothetical protein